MDNLVANPQYRVPAANNSSLMPPRISANGAPMAAMSPDATSFSARGGQMPDLNSIANKVAELDQRIHALESQVSTMNNPNANGSTAMPYAPQALQQPVQQMTPRYQQAPQNYTPAPAAYAPAANAAPAQQMYAPAPQPNYAPASNGATNYAPPMAAPTNPPMMPPLPPAPLPPPPPLPGLGNNPYAAQQALMQQEITDLRSRVDRSISDLNRAIAQMPAAQPQPMYAPQQPQPLPQQLPQQLPAANGPQGNDPNAPQNAPQQAQTAGPSAGDVARQQAGLVAVQNVLRFVKPGSYAPQDQQTVDGAVGRVQQIGQAIAGGDEPGQYTAELFALKHTIQDPAGVGNHPEATRGAQLISDAEQQKSTILDQLATLHATAAQAGGLTPEQTQSRDSLINSYRSLTQIELALDGAKLTKLSATGKQTAGQAIDQLQSALEGITGGATDGKELESQIYRIGQVLRDPNSAPRPAAVEAGAGVVAQISAGEGQLKQRLGEIDDKIAAGAPPEAYAAQRADLMDRLAALNDLNTIVHTARVDQQSPQGAQDVASGLQKATALAQAIVGGEGPEAHRADMFVLKQTFQEPLGSKDNPAVQSASAALQQIGAAEAKNLQQQHGIESAITRGADPRRFDTPSSQLHRQSEDLAQMRQAIQRVDFGGLTPPQQVMGANIIDKMGAIANQVATGHDFTQFRASFADMADQLADLHSYAGPDPNVQSQAQANSPDADPSASNGAPMSTLPAPLPGLASNATPATPTAATPASSGSLDDDDNFVPAPASNAPTSNAAANNAPAANNTPAPLQRLPVINNNGQAWQGGDGSAPANNVAPLAQVFAPAPAVAPRPQPVRPAAPAPAPAAVAPTHAATAPAANPTAGGLYTVKDDDTLTAIAQQCLGNANRWHEIVALNQDKYPTLATKPDHIGPGWQLQMPAGSAPAAAQPAQPRPHHPRRHRNTAKLQPAAAAPTQAPKTPTAAAVTPAPTPVVATPTPAPVVVPAAVVKPTAPNQSDLDAVTWLKANLDNDGKISKQTIARSMPDGAGKQAVLRNFDALMFGFIDPGRAGWSNLFHGDLDRMDQATGKGMTLDGLAEQLTQQLQIERGVTDLPGYVSQLRGQVGGQKPAPVTPAAAPPTPAPSAPPANAANRTQRMQNDLQVYLDDPNNKNGDSAAKSLVNDHPEFMQAATSAQKAQLVGQLVDHHPGSGERAAALKVLQAAAQQNNFQSVLQQVDLRSGEMKRLLNKLGDTKEGVQFATLMMQQGQYSRPAVYNAMDDDASMGLVKSLGFTHPMVGTSDKLAALPEEAKSHMVHELISGNVTWTELYAAQWINQHMDIPVRIPDNLTQSPNEGRV